MRQLDFQNEGNPPSSSAPPNPEVIGHPTKGLAARSTRSSYDSYANAAGGQTPTIRKNRGTQNMTARHQSR